MPSVTAVLDYFLERPLVDWMLRDPKKAKQVSEEAKRVGSLVDLWVRRDLGFATPGFDESKVLPDSPERLCHQGWRTFLAEHLEFPEQVRGMQVELAHGEYLGHPDFLLERPNGQWGICDLKCAAQIRPSYWTQVAAYGWLKDPITPPDFLAILRLDKAKGTYEYQELTQPAELEYERQVWLHYKALYEHGQRVAERYRATLEAEALDVS